MKKILFVIPARGGSKGIPGKNIKPMGGIPLICRSIDIARKFVDDKDICVTTDSDEIIDVVRKHGMEVPFKRPNYLATDTASSYDVLIHALNFYKDKGIEYEWMVLLQPTTPFRKEEDILDALNSVYELKEAAEKMSVGNQSRIYNLEWINALSARNTLICAETALRAALERKESRGCHIRSDYPEVDHDNFLFHYDFYLENGTLCMTTRKPTVTEMQLPTGRKQNVIKYFTDKDLHYSRAFKINFDE